MTPTELSKIKSAAAFKSDCKRMSLPPEKVMDLCDALEAAWADIAELNQQVAEEGSYCPGP